MQSRSFPSSLSFSPVDTLPEAVLLELLAYLPAPDLRSCAAVDTLFHRLARDAIAWQPAWAARAGHTEWSSVKPARVVEDVTLSGGAPLWQLAALQPRQWPSALRRAPIRAVQLEFPRADDLSPWAIGSRGRHGAVRTVRVMNHVLPGNDRAAVANAPFPIVTWRRGVGVAAATARAMEVTSLPFTWAPPAAHSVGSTRGGSVATFLAGAYVVAYFEITVLAVDNECGVGEEKGGVWKNNRGNFQGQIHNIPPRDTSRPAPHVPVVCVGIAAPDFPIGERMPGWDAHSFGWHSDDGRRYHHSPIGSDYGGSFGRGDVIGCGIVYTPLSPPSIQSPLSNIPLTSLDWAALDIKAASDAWPVPPIGSPPGTVFFTRNGKLQGPAFTGVDTERAWYPTVGLDAPWPIRFNFGARAVEPFAFDVRSFNAALIQRAALPPRARLPLMPTRAFLLHALSHVLPLSRTTLAPPPPSTLRATPPHSPLDPSPKVLTGTSSSSSSSDSTPSPPSPSSPPPPPPPPPLHSSSSQHSASIFWRRSTPPASPSETLFLNWARPTACQGGGASGGGGANTQEPAPLAALRTSLRRKQMARIMRYMFTMLVTAKRTAPPVTANHDSHEEDNYSPEGSPRARSRLRPLHDSSLSLPQKKTQATGENNNNNNEEEEVEEVEPELRRAAVVEAANEALLVNLALGNHHQAVPVFIRQNNAAAVPPAAAVLRRVMWRIRAEVDEDEDEDEGNRDEGNEGEVVANDSDGGGGGDGDRANNYDDNDDESNFDHSSSSSDNEDDSGGGGGTTTTTSFAMASAVAAAVAAASSESAESHFEYLLLVAEGVEQADEDADYEASMATGISFTPRSARTPDALTPRL